MEAGIQGAEVMMKFPFGIIIGKFSPLHKGHQSLIDHAFSVCHEVGIISYSNPEFRGCEAERREHWLRQAYPKAHLHVLSPEACPRNDAHENLHREFVVHLCRVTFKAEPDAVFVNDEYGPGFARHLSLAFGKEVQLVNPDVTRSLCPISGTLIRSDIHSYQNFLSPHVYADFVKTVCFLGGESTGKSTLTRLAAEEFHTVFVDEYGRTLWEAKHGDLEFDDLLSIAKTHIQHESDQRLKARRFLFVDTSPLTTMFYSEVMFGQVDPQLVMMTDRRYSHTFLCEPDFPFVQDGTRQGEAFRVQQHEWYRTMLEKKNIPYQTLSGSIENRLEQIRSSLMVRQETIRVKVF